MSFTLAIRVLWRRHRLDRTCRWTRDRLEAHQSRRVDALRRFVYKESSFYQRFHRGLGTRPLTTLPVLTKAALMEDFDALVTDRNITRAGAEAFLNEAGSGLFLNRYVALATSGSTGLRGIFVFNRQEWLDALASITRPLAWVGLRPNPFHPRRSAFLASTAPWHYSARVSHSLSSRLLPALRIDASEALPAIVEKLNAWQPDMMAVYPSVLRQLADEQLSGRLHIQLRHIATSAEVLTQETRQRAGQAWNARIYETYGATEYAPIAAECTYGRKHLIENEALIEIVDERNLPVPPGRRGERVLLTVFNRFTQPLIRYEISDIVLPVDTVCECGRPFRVIEAIEGRQEDVLSFPARIGRMVLIHPKIFHEVLEKQPISGWQVIQHENELQILVVGLRETSCDAIATLIRTRLESEGAMIPALNIRAVSALKRGATGKAPLIRSKLPRSEGYQT